MKRYISIIIFFGAVWGIVESTLGYILHNISFNIGWAIWFPLAFYFMNKVYKQTSSLSAIFFTSCIAASIKLVDLLLPVRVDKVLNPAVSIILESIVVMAVFKVLEYEKELRKPKWFHTLVMSFGWRTLYIMYIFILPQFFIRISPVRGLEPFLSFMIVESIVNSMIISSCIIISQKVDKKARFKEFNLKPIYSLCLLILAVFVQWRF